MKRLWLLQLLLNAMLTFTFNVCSKGVHKDKEKNPDVLKKFRSFADTVTPGEKAKLIKNFDKPRVKHPAVFVDEPLRQVTRKVTFASTTHNAIDGIGMRLYPSGPSIQRNDTYNDDEAEGDNVDTYIDEREKNSIKEKRNPEKMKEQPRKSSNESEHGDSKFSKAVGVVELTENKNGHREATAGDALRNAIFQAMNFRHKPQVNKEGSLTSNLPKPTKDYNPKNDRNLVKTQKSTAAKNCSNAVCRRKSPRLEDNSNDVRKSQNNGKENTAAPVKGNRAIKLKGSKLENNDSIATAKIETDSLTGSKVDDIHGELMCTKRLKNEFTFSPEKVLPRVNEVEDNLKKSGDRKKTKSNYKKSSYLKSKENMGEMNKTRPDDLYVRVRNDTEKNGVMKKKMIREDSIVERGYDQSHDIVVERSKKQKKMNSDNKEPSTGYKTNKLNRKNAFKAKLTKSNCSTKEGESSKSVTGHKTDEGTSDPTSKANGNPLNLVINAKKTAEERNPSVAKIIRQVKRVKGGDPPTFDELIRILHAAGISDKDLAEIEKAEPWKCEHNQCGLKYEVVKMGEKNKPYPPAINISSVPISYPPQCISTCPTTCAPECTPECCTQKTAPPPVKKVHSPPTTEKTIRWFERPRYEPGPNIPPPIFPQAVASGCDVACTRSCIPLCKQHGCCKIKPLFPVIGCSKQCTPNVCSIGCPAHCCARHVTSVNPSIKIMSL